MLGIFLHENFAVLDIHPESVNELLPCLHAFFRYTFEGFKTRFEPNGKRGQKYCFDENANECKGKNPHCSVCHVLQLAKSPLWYSPYKRRTKSEIQPNSHGLTGHAKSHNDEDLWLTKNNPLRLVIIHSKRNLVIHII